MPARADALRREGRGLSLLPIVCHFILFGSGFLHSQLPLLFVGTKLRLYRRAVGRGPTREVA